MIVQKVAQVKIRIGHWDVITAKWNVVVSESGDVVGGVNAGGLCAAANPSDMVPGWIWPESTVARNLQQSAVRWVLLCFFISVPSPARLFCCIDWRVVVKQLGVSSRSRQFLRWSVIALVCLLRTRSSDDRWQQSPFRPNYPGHSGRRDPNGCP